MQDRSFPLFNSPYSSFHFLKILHKLRYWKMQIIKDGLRFFFQHTLVPVGDLKKPSAPADGAPLLSKQLLHPMEYSQLCHGTRGLPAKAIMEMCFHACRLHSLGDLLVYYPHIKQKHYE